jgi:hypothetical protein
LIPAFLTDRTLTGQTSPSVDILKVPAVLFNDIFQMRRDVAGLPSKVKRDRASGIGFILESTIGISVPCR